MPNHVSHKVTVSGAPEEIKGFKDFVRYKENGEYVEDTNRFFCFNSIIPMPEILRKVESGSRQHEGERALKILEGKSVDMGFLFANPDHWQKCGVNDAMSYARYIEKEKPDSIEMAKLARQAMTETGYKDWYDWSIANWGTKWDAYDQGMEEVGDEEVIYTFDTAWSVPYPVLEKLSEEFPELKFEVKYFDEGHNFWGVVEYVGDELLQDRQSEEEDKDSLCLELKGYDPKEEEE